MIPHGVEAIICLSETLQGSADDERFARHMRRRLLNFYAPGGEGRGAASALAGPGLRCAPPLLRFNGTVFEELDV